MSDIIQLLPDSVANQIAAGEVIQRPSSAVKELLENAVDAGATEIELILKDSGRTLLQVADNGCGMSQTDARLAFERHATSKIRDTNDLFHIRTLGFRGEALASIASIAHVELKSRMHDAELGTSVIIEGSEVKEQKACQANAGTSIAVKNLFFNVPARRNFLKSDAIEFGHIEEEFKRIALINNDTGFTLYHNDKLIYKLIKSGLQQRIISIFGDVIKKKLIPIEESTDLVSLKGFVSKIEFAKKTRGEQYFFVNKRFIKHPYLNHAIEQAFNELLPEKMHPSYFVSLDIDPARIDVNIHPTKTEVKFLDERFIYSILRSAVKKSLGQFTLVQQIEFDPIQSISFDSMPKGYIPKQPSVEVNPNFNPFEKKYSKPQESYREQSNKANWTKFFEQEAFPKKESNTSTHSDNLIPVSHTEDMVSKESISGCCSVIQVQNRYLVSDMKSGLLIIDQQRAHERVLFEFYHKRKQDVGGIQQLLFPETCRLSPADTEILRELLPEVKSLGFDLEELGKNTFVINGIPPNLPNDQISETIEEIISQFKNNLLHKFTDKSSSVALALAKRMAVKKDTPLEQEEMQSIMARLFTCECPDVSPDGKKNNDFTGYSDPSREI